jgi:hypothetical protein
MTSFEKLGSKGRYTVLSLSRDLTDDEIKRARRYVRGDTEARNGLPIQREYEVHNIVPTSGKNVLTRLLCADTTYSGAINYGAFGSGTGAFTSSSTHLTTEVYRKLPSGAAADTNIAYIDWFVASGDVANQTFNEFGAFIDGTSTANSGQAISLALTGGWVKSGAIFITLAITLT